MKKIWTTKNLSAGYTNSEGSLHDVNLHIEMGEKVALVGRERGGRQLLLKVLAGLRPFREGSLNVFEQEMPCLPYYADWDEIIPREIVRKMGVSLDQDGLLSNVSVREGLELLFRFRYGDHNQKLRDGAQKVVSSLCERFKIQGVVDQRPHFLSSSERRRASLARAFLAKPQVLVLENPSQGVSDLGRGLIVDALHSVFGEADRTVLMSTGDLALARQFCPRWILVDEGRIIFDGWVKDLWTHAHPVAQQIRTAWEKNYSGKSLDSPKQAVEGF